MRDTYGSSEGPLRVALVTPSYAPAIRGNAITVARLQHHLEARGAEVKIWDMGGRDDISALAKDILDFKPTVVHGFHACRFSRVAHRIRQTSHTPIVVTVTGTDVNISLYISDTRRITARCLRTAGAVVFFASETARRVSEDVSLLEENVHIIPQAVELPEAQKVEIPFSKSEDGFVFCMPAGLRAVKNVLFPIAPLHSLRTEFPNISLLYAGPVVEQHTADSLMQEIEGLPWVKYIGDVPHDQMAHLYRMCDVVVNSSLSEGMSGALMEAMSMGTPVLASNVEANRAIIEDGVDGLLFDTEQDFMRQATRLIKDPNLRASLGARAAERMRGDHSPETEAASYEQLYRDLARATNEG